MCRKEVGIIVCEAMVPHVCIVTCTHGVRRLASTPNDCLLCLGSGGRGDHRITGVGRGRWFGSGGRGDHRITGVGRGRSWGAEEEGIVGSRKWVEVGPGERRKR